MAPTNKAARDAAHALMSDFAAGREPGLTPQEQWNGVDVDGPDVLARVAHHLKPGPQQRRERREQELAARHATSGPPTQTGKPLDGLVEDLKGLDDEAFAKLTEVIGGEETRRAYGDLGYEEWDETANPYSDEDDAA